MKFLPSLGVVEKEFVNKRLSQGLAKSIVLLQLQTDLDGRT